MNAKFFEFCKNNNMILLDDSGSLTVQGQAVMETKNCVVAAGAGSGKTTVLSYRFLRMVAQGISPERILTITFTKKATAEMKGRIYELLQKGHEAGFVSHAAMKKFSEVTISTVDSFCSEIVRKDAVHQGFPVDFSIQEDKDFKLMSNSIVDKLLEKHQKDQTVKLLHSYLSVDEIEQIFTDIAYKFLNITKPFDDNSIQVCVDFVQQELEKARDNLLQCGKLKADQKKLLSLLNDGLEKENLSTLKELYKLIQEYETELFNQKRTSGVLSFNDVMQLAIKILKENAPIRDFYKAKFDNIMIDEFQDNNDDYRKLLYLLSEKPNSHICDEEGIPVKENLCPDKIFLVGDEKQSIYKFRGADVSVFKRLCTDLCSKPIELKRNWRSEPAIIDFCNAIFPEHIMPRPTTTCESYEAQYEDLETRPATPGLNSKVVFLHPEIPEGQNKTDTKTEAQVVASFIKKICSPESTYLVPDDKAKDENGNPVLRAPKYNEIGFLLRSSTQQALFEQAFTEQRIPYTVTEPRSLMKGNLVNDFYNALQYCVFPYDKISFASYLKSPFCSLKDDQIQQILNDPSQQVEDGLEGLKQVIATGSICKMVDYLWFDMGYRDYMLSKELNRPYWDDFANLYSLAIDYDKNGESLVAFLDYLRPLLKDSQKIEQNNVFKESIEGVQVMTIHKSKGLAFKVVIIANMNSGSRKTGGFKPEVYTNDQHKLAIRYVAIEKDKKLANPIYEVFESEEVAKDNAEAKRILYVAATRARYHLVFSGTDLTSELKNEKPNSLLAYLLHAIEETGDNLKNYEELSLAAPENVDIADSDKPKEYFKQIFDFAVVPQLTSSIMRGSVTHEAANKEASKATMASNGRVALKKLPTLDCDDLVREHNFATGFGTLTHKILEDNIKGQQDQIPFDVRELLAEENFSEEQKVLLVSCAKKLASNFLNSNLYDQIKAMKLMSEKPFLLFNGTSYVDGVIDLLALSESEAYIIDFKTDSVFAEEDHKYQLEQYTKAVKSIYPEKTVHAYVFYLREEDLSLAL